MDITINGNINFNGDNNFSGNTLLDNDATFNDLISKLKQNPSLAKASMTQENGELELVKTVRQPGVIQLRTQYDRIAGIPVGSGYCEVYSNGFAIFDNGDRKTVVWVPACATRTYRFTQLTNKEREYLRDEETLDESILGDMPWYYPVIMAGEDRIEWNLAHPRNTSNMSDADLAEEQLEESLPCWQCAGKTLNPEDMYIQKETDAECREMLTDKQREVYDLYYVEQLTQNEIAQHLGISQKAVDYRLDGVEKKLKNFFR